MPDWPVTTWVAIYAAFVATANVGWTVYKGVTDRGKLSLSLGVGPTNPISGRPVVLCVGLEVVNDGRRPVTLGAGGLILTDGLFSPPGLPPSPRYRFLGHVPPNGPKDAPVFESGLRPAFPHELTENRKAEFLTPVSFFPGEGTVRGWVEDSRGKRYFTKEYNVRDLMRAVQ